ncbi:MAG: LacI family transcriptional regulator [Spirochaetia bacterium]|jgi:LacI family transcriptional regulator|nr:LacI family transcriptional regulator [Spirochaetia bacterium]
MVSIRDVAKQAGVSVSTVSRVINKKSCVSTEKRNKILRIIKETGYVPNRAARDMVLKQTSTIAIVLPATFNLFQKQLFADIAHNLEKFGYRTSFYFVEQNQEGESTCLHRLKGERLDGIILLNEIAHPEFHDYLSKNNIPTVIVTFEKPEWEVTSIHISEEDAADAVVSYLIKQGHRKIALLCGRKYSFAIQRQRGYCRALKKAGIPYDENLIVYIDSYSVSDGMAGMKKLLDEKREFTALFAMTDELAIGAIRQLKDAGYAVPKDISVVGFDGIDISAYSIPRLTTILQPLKEMGQMSATLIHSLICNKKQLNVNIVLPFTLRESESTAPLVH